MVDHKLDMFEALAAVDRRDAGWLERQSDDARKGFAPPVFLRWASAISGDGVAGEYTLLAINERVNLQADLIMGAYPDLMFRLAASCGTGRRERHEWLPMTGRRRTANKARDLLARHHPVASEAEIDMLLSMYSAADFKEFVAEIGLPPDEAKEAQKAYDKFSRPAKGQQAAPKARRDRRP